MGKQTNRWNRIRKKIRKDFEKRGIEDACELRLEGCFMSPTDLAHIKRRSQVLTDEEYEEVIMLCRKCHNEFDNPTKFPASHQLRIGRDIIKRRDGWEEL